MAHIAVHRLLRARASRGLSVEIPIDHRAFPLELINARPTPKRLLDLEVDVCSRLETDAGWSRDSDPWTYPVSTLPALEAVQAAKAQGPEVSVQLDAALRRAMFVDWRCLAVHHVVLDVARAVDGLNVDELWGQLEAGHGRTEVFHQYDAARSDLIPGSPTFVLPDGTVEFNPGLSVSWTDGPGSDLTIERNDPDEIGDLIDRTLAMQPAD